MHSVPPAACTCPERFHLGPAVYNLACLLEVGKSGRRIGVGLFSTCRLERLLSPFTANWQSRPIPVIRDGQFWNDQFRGRRTLQPLTHCNGRNAQSQSPADPPPAHER
jgi:hypothetical protein